MSEDENAQELAGLYQSGPVAPGAGRIALDAAFQSFSHEAGIQVSAYLRTPVGASYEGSEEVTYAEFSAARPAHSCAAVIASEGLGRKTLLDMDPTLFFALLELMLGGKSGSQLSITRAPTEIEKQLVTVVMRSITSELERAWAAVAADSSKVQLNFAGIEPESRLPALFPGALRALASKFLFQIGEHSGVLTIMTPLETVNTEFNPVTVSGPDAAPVIPEGDRICELLMESSLRVDAWLDGVSMQFRDLVQLREGYVIKFDYATSRSLTCTINGTQGFDGQIVSTGRKRAFLIEHNAS